MTAQELREIHRDINSDREWCEVERVRLTDEERRALTINSSALRANATYLPTVGRARLRRDLAGFALLAFMAVIVSGFITLAAHFVFGWRSASELTKVTHDTTISGGMLFHGVRWSYDYDQKDDAKCNMADYVMAPVVSPTKVQHDHGDENSDARDQRRHADADRKP